MQSFFKNKNSVNDMTPNLYWVNISYVFIINTENKR